METRSHLFCSGPCRRIDRSGSSLNQRLHSVSRIYIDETGLGGFFAQDAIKSGLKNALGVFLSLQKKQEIMDYFKRKMQDGHLHFRRDSELMSEISAERYQLSKTGQPQFSHPTGTHDDRLWAFRPRSLRLKIRTPNIPPSRRDRQKPEQSHAQSAPKPLEAIIASHPCRVRRSLIENHAFRQ